MKRDKINNMSVFLIAIIFIFLIAARDVKGEYHSTGGKVPFAGVWAIWGFQKYTTTDNPWLKGAMVATQWKKLESSNNNFNFGDLDYLINKAIANGYEYIMFKIYVGPKSPLWIYDPVSEGGGGVPSVNTDSPIYGQPYPYYIHDNYKNLFKRMINKVYTHIEAYPANIRNRIIGIQAPIGASGDTEGYKGKIVDTDGKPVVGSPYEITKSEWDAYSREMFSYFYNVYKNTDPPIVPMFAPDNTNYSLNNWVNENLPHHWNKFAHGGHCYQQHNISEPYLPPSEEYQSDGWAILIRDEADRYRGGKFSEAPVWYMYWTGLHGLEVGLDIWNIMNVDLVNEPESILGFNFFNEYAGYHSPSESHGAWIAFRDGLDANDVSRFPEATYGTRYRWWQQTQANSAQRYIKIANDFAEYGAKQQSDYIPRFWLKSCGYAGQNQNDVGWDTIPGNYKMYITQINPLTTSQGYWRIGPTSQPYGRYGRGFNNAAGLNNIYLDLDDNFFFGAQQARSITIRVVYFDKGSGSWALRYNAVGNPNKIAYTQIKTNTGFWKERIVTLDDTYFNNAGPQGADIYLANTDSEDDIFHMVEIERPPPGKPGDTEPPSYPTAFRLKSK